MSDTKPDATSNAGNGADPLIDDVRTVRRELSERFGNDVEKLAEYLRRVGESYRRSHPMPESESAQRR